MPLRDYLQRFFSTDIGRIVGCNAADGVASGLHSRDDVKEFFDAAYQGMGADDGKPFSEYFAQMQDLCFKDHRTPPRYLGACRHGRTYAFPDTSFTLVLPLGVLNLVSPDDRQRFADETGEFFEIPASVYKLPAAHRYFQLDPAERLGGQALWFTFKAIIDAIVHPPWTRRAARPISAAMFLG